MASTYRSKQNYDQQILSADDYATLQGYKRDWYNAATTADRKKANQAAEALRAKYGYSMGASGSDFTLLGNAPGISDTTGAGLLALQTGPDPQWEEAYQTLLTQYQQRDPFTYDPQSDPSYQALERSYQQQGQRAMTDTVAQIADLTGGYGSTYAQQTGQAAYQNSLAELAGEIPSLQRLALEAYENAGNDLWRQVQAAGEARDQAQREYDTRLNYWQTLAQQEQNAYQAQQQAAQSYAQQQSSAQTQAQKTAWSQAMDSIALGVVPSAETLATAGISQAWAQAMAWAAIWR